MIQKFDDIVSKKVDKNDKLEELFSNNDEREKKMFRHFISKFTGKLVRHTTTYTSNG